MKLIDNFKRQYTLSTQITIVIGIIAALNFLSYQIFTRFDLTQGKIYSLSDISKATAANLNDIVNIKAYFSAELPPQFMNVRQETKDILAEYQNYAPQKLRVEFIDPKDNLELQQKLQILGIPQLQFNILENDKYQVINGFLAIVVSFGDKQQAIPVVSDTKNLEYQLTSAIKKVTADAFPELAFASGNGELSADSDISAAGKKLAEIYATREADLSGGKKISDDVNTLIVAGPTAKFSQRAQYVIDQFLMSGGKSAIFLVNGVNVTNGLQANKNEAAPAELLAGYGFNIEPSLVLDAASDMASFNQGFITFTTQYPFFVKVGESGLDKNNAAVAKLQSIVFPWASPLSVAENKSGAKVEVLAKTTPQAWTMRDNFDLSPQGDFGVSGNKAVYNLAVSLSGPLKSAFAEYIPQNSESGEHRASTDNARVIVISNANFIKDNFVSRYPDNLTFFQNIVDSVTLDADLITIRSKEVNERPLSQIADSRKRALKYGNVFGVTVVVLAFGLWRYFGRKKTRFADEL
ncbi:hypothetical protein A3G56_02325 [Candidatus Falkowbacteria bacterium RIFCSPLOWO2_12_FULL_45_10]|uniref:Uncharacterized protein n=1 Tax=Candidatus Falkowbacteria bacterium RIFCSPLOWO2_12_FULL_45_10 TaxID=1797990 RepID=A0A1F5RW31_9BACT|nr:MAG: hypothetical protein A3G56_02325 [Candidatus Falkowbacteria bacterium RIFCSPLOWO2_12_FULL_45_10]